MMEEQLDQIVGAFQALYGHSPAVVVRAPGRVNLLGEHVDYNEGWVMPAAIDRAAWLAVEAVAEPSVTLHALDFGEYARFELNQLQPKGEPSAAHWIDYPAGVAWAMQTAGYTLPGLRGVLHSDVPIGAGVSSSAAVETAFVLAWEALAGLTLTGLQRAALGRQAENGYLGLQSGIMDQFASLHAAADQLILLDCRSLTHELVPLSAETTLLIADSGVRRQLVGSEYNTRRAECAAAVALLQPYLPAVRALRDVSPAQFEPVAHRLPLPVRRRAQHVVEECARVLDGAARLRQGDLAGFGRNLIRSHISLRDLYEVSVPELDILAAAAWETPGCYGARLTGAGFGGCVVALAGLDAAGVTTAMSRAFEKEFGRIPAIFTTRAAAGAARIL